LEGGAADAWTHWLEALLNEQWPGCTVSPTDANGLRGGGNRGTSSSRHGGTSVGLPSRREAELAKAVNVAVGQHMVVNRGQRSKGSNVWLSKQSDEGFVR
jgi:hypothetical protein